MAKLHETQLMQVQAFLGNTVQIIEDFLNETTLTDLKSSKDENGDYVKAVLSQFRKLLVFSQEGRNACGAVLKGQSFQQAAAERLLYRIYHQCIEEFFDPKNDAWHEDSRSAYTGRISIRFNQPVHDSIILLIRSLEGDFQRMREELEYYETDYRAKMAQSK